MADIEPYRENYMTDERREMFVQQRISEYKIIRYKGKMYGMGDCIVCGVYYSKSNAMQKTCNTACGYVRQKAEARRRRQNRKAMKC